mmetsp:Transcript_5983/g.19438  ORF Transcript_5983/g.19438 Transcript_5983/m.19438 type:complete len:222 (-) Transcript_5983:85-750(-)
MRVPEQVDLVGRHEEFAGVALEEMEKLGVVVDAPLQEGVLAEVRPRDLPEEGRLAFRRRLEVVARDEESDPRAVVVIVAEEEVFGGIGGLPGAPRRQAIRRRGVVVEDGEGGRRQGPDRPPAPRRAGPNVRGRREAVAVPEPRNVHGRYEVAAPHADHEAQPLLVTPHHPRRRRPLRNARAVHLLQKRHLRQGQRDEVHPKSLLFHHHRHVRHLHYSLAIL